MVQNYKFLENFETFLIWKSDFLVFFNEIEIFSDFFWSWGMYTLNLMHASLTTDEPFNGEDNWYFSFKNCTTLIPEIRMNKLLLCQIAVIILISSLQGEWTGLYYLPNPKIRILPNSYPKILKILRSEMTMVSLSPNPTRKFFSPKNPKIKKKNVLMNCVLRT